MFNIQVFFRPVCPAVSFASSKSANQSSVSGFCRASVKIFALVVCAVLAMRVAQGQSTIFSSSAVPSQTNYRNSDPIEVGVKFTSSSSGYITGLRFYKGTRDAGTHVGHLWTATGALLGSATFTNETTSGWQQVNFSSPIAVTANTIYVASYFAPQGRYSLTSEAFRSSGVSRPPLQALANNVSGPNGVYAYTSTGAFPTNGHNATNYWVDVVFTASQQPTTPQLTLSSSSLNFGSVAVNSSATQSLTLTSTGTAPLTVNAISLSGAAFKVVAGTLPVTLNPNQTLTVPVTFTPTAAGSASGQLTIASNASAAVVSLSGTGASNPQLTLSSSSLSFGNIAVNTSSTQSLTLRSSGTTPVTVNTVSLNGAAFSVVAGTLPVTLNPSQSLTISVTFTPKAAGAVSGQLTITSNSSTGSSAVVALSGTGTASNPQLTLSTTSLSFGSVADSSSATLSLTLTSSGTTAVTVNSALVSGAGFSLIGGSFPVTLNPSQSTTLQVKFAPTTAGSLTGTLAISSNSSNGGNVSVALSGTGTSASHQIVLTWNAPTGSGDPIAGYDIYRSTGSGSAQLVNSSIDSQTTYTDTSVTSGTTYTYYVTSVDQSGVQSTPSNSVTVSVP